MIPTEILIYFYLFKGHAGGCGITDDISQWMDRIQNSAVDTDLPPPIPFLKSKNKLKERGKIKAKEPAKPPPPATFSYENPHDKYSREANENEVPHARSKRATRIREDRNTCSLYIQTDPLIWRHIREGFPEVMSP